jgi:hypothetical protein
MNTNDEDTRAFRASIAAARRRLEARLIIMDFLVERDFLEVGHGIVFVHAPWAGQSMLALRAISSMLCEAEFAEIPLWIANIATVDLKRDTFGRVNFGGFGETFWIRNGCVRKVGSNYCETDLNELRAITQKVFQ